MLRACRAGYGWLYHFSFFLLLSLFILYYLLFHNTIYMNKVKTNMCFLSKLHYLDVRNIDYFIGILDYQCAIKEFTVYFICSFYLLHIVGLNITSSV